MKKVKLGDILEVKRGASLSGEYYATSGDLVRLTLGNFKYPGGGFKPNTAKDNIYFNGPVKEQYILHKGDIITPLTEQVRGLLGETALIPEDNKYIQSGDIALVIPDETKLDKFFAYYLVSSSTVRNQLAAAAQQTKIRHTSPEKIKFCQAWIPDLDQQHKIGLLLSKMDQKIANNNAISAKLEAMVKTIYDYWFLQFEFPNTEGNPYKSSGGEMVWNDELQHEIPAGWEVDNLGNYFDVSKGTLLTASDAKLDGPYKVVSAGLDYAYHHNEYNREKDTISISTSGANAGFVRYWHERIYANDCITIRHNNVSNTIYAYNFLKAIQNYLYSQARGSAQPHVYLADISTLKFVIPPVEIMERFAQIIGPQNSNLEVIQKQNQQLASLRDFLLPMLMNGQVTINE